MKIKRYTLKEQIVSLIIGITLVLPLCAGVIASTSNEPMRAIAMDITRESNQLKLETETATKTITTEPTRDYLGTFEITAYCSCESCCPGTSDGLTYTETVATEGRTIAVDPNVIPLGSIIEINGANYVAEDIGGAIKSNRIDIFFNSHSEAREFGRQYHDVFMIGG